MVSVIRTPASYKRIAFWAIAFICVVWLFHHPAREYGRALLLPQRPQIQTEQQQTQQDAEGQPSSQEGTKNQNTNLQPAKEIDSAAETARLGYNQGVPRYRMPSYFQKILSWNPPVHITDHYPPYDQYDLRDFDPNRWEGFDQNNDIYLKGTLKSLGTEVPAPAPYLPYPKYNSDEWRRKWQGDYVECETASGSSLSDSYKDVMRAYKSWPKGFPEPTVGSFEALGLDKDVCFDRHSRLDVYGLDLDFDSSSTTDGFPEAPLSGAMKSDTDFKKVDWGRLQDSCVQRNANRYKNAQKANLRVGMAMEFAAGASLPQEKRQEPGSVKEYKKRTAILIRTWDTYEYRKNDVQAIRSLITELSLLSGGEYSVFLLVNIKDIDDPIFEDDAVYEQRLREYVPAELRSIAILWTERICQQWYPHTGEWSVYFQQFMPLQWFSKTHPEFDYVWNWEMDARLIGHHYHFLEQLDEFTTRQPRKYLWERNSRYYFPAAHGTFQEFFDETNRIVANADGLHTVWGPDTWTDIQHPVGPPPPTTEAEDNFTWGVGEEADFITLLPLWDPRNTLWSYRDRLYNYPEDPEPAGKDKEAEAEAEEEEDGGGSGSRSRFTHVPRRVFINTLARFSKKLLATMHEENQWGLGMASEMWPGSIALHHGLKAVYAPHPIWVSHVWPSGYLDAVFNADGWGAGSLPGGSVDQGRGVGFDPAKEQAGLPQTGSGPNREGKPGRWSQEKDCAYNPDREHNFGGWSWYFWSDFSKVLYRRWLGWNAAFGFATASGERTDDQLGETDWQKFEKDNARLCLPYMLLHPVKNVTLFDDEHVY